MNGGENEWPFPYRIMEVFDTPLRRFYREVHKEFAKGFISPRYLFEGVEVVLSEVPVQIELLPQDRLVVFVSGILFTRLRLLFYNGKTLKLPSGKRDMAGLLWNNSICSHHLKS